MSKRAAAKHPINVLMKWVGHEVKTTQMYYLDVPESEYTHATQVGLFDERRNKVASKNGTERTTA